MTITLKTSLTSGVKVLALVSGLDEVNPPANIMDDSVSMSGLRSIVPSDLEFLKKIVKSFESKAKKRLTAAI